MKRLLITLLSILIVLVTPLALSALSLRLTTNHWLIRWEYSRPDLPPDPYGLSTGQRLDMAGVCVDYLGTGAGIRTLADLQVDGRPAFNPRELQHMWDVKRVFWWLLRGGLVAGLIMVVGTIILALRPATRRRAPVALLGGSALTIGLLVAVGVFMVSQWDSFFVSFHELFFPPGTWTFSYADTLIRLFPVRFWMGVGAVIVGLLTLEALLLGLGALLWLRLEKRGSVGEPS